MKNLHILLGVQFQYLFINVNKYEIKILLKFMFTHNTFQYFLKDTITTDK